LGFNHDVRKEGGVSSIVADEQKRPIRRPKPLVALKAKAGRVYRRSGWEIVHFGYFFGL